MEPILLQRTPSWVPAVIWLYSGHIEQHESAVTVTCVVVGQRSARARRPAASRITARYLWPPTGPGDRSGPTWA